MFCNKNSPTPVCCENIDTKKAIHIDTQFSDDIEQLSPPATPPSSTRKNEAEPMGVEDYARTTTIVNRDMGINGECATNARLVLDADGKRPIPCDRHHKCPEVRICLVHQEIVSYKVLCEEYFVHFLFFIIF